ncbi:MAG: glycosyltransferase [Nitrospirota bacterium]
MSPNPSVSIIVRTKDRPILLKRALRSIADQTYRPIEVVLVNDGGCDLDIEELGSILGTVSLKYIKLDVNRGRAFAGNVGIENAGGELVGFLDDDDLFYPNHVSTLAGFMSESGSSLAYTDAYIVRNRPTKDGYLPYFKEIAYSRDFDREWLLFQNYIPFLSFLARRELLQQERFDTQFDLFEDWELLIRLAQHDRFHRIPEATAEYHLRDDNTTLDFNPSTFAHIEARYKVYKKHMNLVTESGIRIFEALHAESERNKALFIERETELNTIKDYTNKKEQELEAAESRVGEAERELETAREHIRDQGEKLNEISEYVKSIERVHAQRLIKNKAVSIVILTHNGEKYIQNLLNAIFAQRHQNSVEVIVIDSASQDDTCKIAASHNVKVHVIEKSAFSHSKTRNFGIASSSGQFIIFITQDALPLDQYWLVELLKPFELYPDLAASYSRQIPAPDCNPVQARDIYIGAPCVDEIRYAKVDIPSQKSDYANNVHRYIRFSNVSACYRGDLLRENPFDERLKMVEDQEWSKRMIENGHSIYYASKSIVVHSHNFTVPQTYQRFYDYGCSFKKFIVDSPPRRVSVFKSTVYDCINDVIYIVNDNRRHRSKLKWICLSPFLRFAANYGLYKGWQCG